PPRTVIDLSLPPRERYKSLARSQADKLRSLASLLDELLLDYGVPWRLIKPLHMLSQVFLRQVRSSEETEELKGIAEVTGLPMYLLVAFNVLLDLLMGCTSGGVLSQEDSQPRSSAKMLHFRTLDWTMDPLREVVVQLDFIRSKSSQPDTVLASSITYIGFVGVLTGVRPGLSLSLNFRAVHDATSTKDQVRFYLHHLMVLLGRRPSIASILRHHLLADYRSMGVGQSALELVIDNIAKRHTTAAYLIFSDGHSTITMEKDYSTALTDRSDTFIVRTNHDLNDHGVEPKPIPVVTEDVDIVRRAVHTLDEILDESRERLGCITKQYETKMKMNRASQRRSARALRQNSAQVDKEANLLPTRTEIIQWLCTWTTTNESTHYSVVMDPKAGKVVWCRVYPRP
ncbi:uncharacterized protein CC84DRAFT_1044967, partial [Paraphaeosphaeria sporulosa]